MRKIAFGAMLTVAAVSAFASEATSSRPSSAPATKPSLPRAPEGVTILQDVAYLPPDREEKLDLYLPTERGKDVRSPAIVMIHGGGWIGGDKAASREFNVGTTLAKAGYVCVSVNYQLKGPKRWPTNLHDCKNAVRFLRKYADKYQINPDQIGVMGGSAGGHLALMVAYTTNVPELEPSAPYPGISSEVRAVIDLYGITNLLTRRATDKKGNPVGSPRTQSALFQATAEQDPAAWKLASPVYHVSSKTPPTLILHGTIDTTVDRDQGKELAAQLAKHGVEHELIMIPGVGHTFDLQSWRRKPLPNDLRPVVIEFFDKHVRR